MGKRMAVTPEREDAFLEAFIASGGSFSDACSAASPHLDGDGRHPPAHQTWRNRLKNDLRFAERFAEARQQVADALIKEMYRRAVHGVERGHYYKGQPTRDEHGNPVKERHYSDQLLLSRLKSLLPEFQDQSHVHHHLHGGDRWQISAADLEALNDAQLADFTRLLAVIRDHRAAMSAVNGGDVEVIEDDVDYVSQIEQEIANEGHDDG
jgi:hypothetical protein